jgi:integrase
MRVPSYRNHSSGQARVTINGRDHLLGKYGSPASREAYGRLIAEFSASASSGTFGKSSHEVLMEDVLLAYLQFAKKYYHASTEYANLKLAAKPVTELYGSLPAAKFAAAEFKAVRAWWLSDTTRSRQYVNKQMKRTLRIVKWAVGEGLLPPENYTAVKCVDPLRRGRCDVREAPGVTCVDQKLVDATLPHMTQVLADMVRFQQLVGCRPGELVRIKPGMVDLTGDVWTITLAEHKTAYRDKVRTIYVGPQAQKVLAPYLLRAENSYCFSPIESEQQRRQAAFDARVTPLSCGNRPGTNRIARKPRKAPSACYTAGTYARAIRYACGRAEVTVWAPIC